jgi:phospholipid/cholesterol/gamma-HCH transport system substrate-binding protein
VNLEATSANVAKVTADARDVAERAKSGPGLVHTLIYDDKLAEGTAGTMAELNGALRAVRTGNGLAHAVVYGDDQGSSETVVANLAAMSEDLKKITGDLRAGRGTLGGLLVDPSVYEDVKNIVGNVERNQVLRALVRYSIKQNEGKAPDAAVTEPAKGAGAPGVTGAR